MLDRRHELYGPLGCRTLTVHHRNYGRLGRERRADVELLCWTCHLYRDRWTHQPWRQINT